MKPYFPYPTQFKGNSRGLPHTYYIETAMACNLRCPECAIGSEQTTRDRGLLSVDNFNIIWDKVKDYAELVYLHKWGEPTMNPNLPYFIDKVSQHAHSHIMTNGLLLDGSKISSYLDAGLGTLFFSIDGVTQSVYEKYRVGGNCELAWKNIEMAKTILESHNYKTDLIAQMIVFRHNEHELDAFIERCNQLGLRYHLRKPYIRFGSVDRPENAQFLMKIYATPEEHLQAISKCHFLHSTLTITIDGSTLLCSQDYDKSFTFGNVLEDGLTIDEMWNGPKGKAMREDIINLLNVPDICRSRCTLLPRSY